MFATLTKFLSNLCDWLRSMVFSNTAQAIEPCAIPVALVISTAATNDEDCFERGIKQLHHRFKQLSLSALASAHYEEKTGRYSGELANALRFDFQKGQSKVFFYNAQDRHFFGKKFASHELRQSLDSVVINRNTLFFATNDSNAKVAIHFNGQQQLVSSPVFM